MAHAETVAAAVPSWCFTNGHAVEGVTDFYSSLQDLHRVDWEAVRTWKWGGKWLLGNPDVGRKKQAEFLVHARFPWSLFHSIGVLDFAMAERVRAALADVAHKPRVTIETNWYYNY